MGLKLTDKKELAYRILTVTTLLFFIFILTMKSNYNLFLPGGHQASDGDVFRTIGWLMTKGYVPYRDIFDHKGPVLYFIQYIATFLGTVRGIWAVEVVFMTASVFICYRFARKFNNRLLSVFVILLVFSRWYECGYGNSCEEFSVLFQVVSIYFFVDFFHSPEYWIREPVTEAPQEREEGNICHRAGNNWFDARVVIIGISFACVFFMKANFCAVWIVFCPVIFVYCIKMKYWNSLRRFVVSFLIGVLLITIPVAWYLIQNGAMEDFIYDYFIFNGLYTSDVTRVNIKTRVVSFFTFANTVTCILAFLIMALRIKKREKTFVLDITYTVFMLVALLLVTMSGQTYGKMEIALIPFLIYPFSLLFEILDYRNKYYEKTAMVVAGYLIITLVFPSWANQIVDASADINKYVYKTSNLMYDDVIVNYIKENTSNDDKISVFGNSCVYYLYTNREPASKYIFLPDPSVDNEIVEEYFEDLRANPPKIIVAGVTYTAKNEWVQDEMNDFLEEYGYELVEDLDGDYPVYQLD